MHPEFRFQPGRRDLFQLAAAATGIAAFGGVNLLAGAQQGASAGHSRRRLRAAFSNIGLQVSWCAQGKEAAEYWGRLFNVDVTWFDPELSATKQLALVEEIASEKWDFVAIQAVDINTITEPVVRMIEAGIPVIDMDTLIAPLDQIDVLTFLAPDNDFMGAAVTQALVDAIGGEGTIIMTQGALGHTGAQGRARGFQSVIDRFPGVEVLATDSADWDVAKTAQLWETYLNTFQKIDAAFFHNDDMALAAANVMKAHGRTEILIGGVDAMPPAIQAVVDGRMHATVRNSSCRIHGGAIVAGVAAARGPKTGLPIPKQIVIDGPIVTKANAARDAVDGGAVSDLNPLASSVSETQRELEESARRGHSRFARMARPPRLERGPPGLEGEFLCGKRLRSNRLRGLPRGRATRLVCLRRRERREPVLLDAGLYSSASERQPSGGSIGAIIGPRIEGNRRAWGSLMNSVDDSFE